MRILLTQSTIVPGILASRTGAVELDPTDAAHLVFGHVPSPRRDGVPLLDSDFHGGVPIVEVAQT